MGSPQMAHPGGEESREMEESSKEDAPEQTQQPVVDAAEYAGHGCCWWE